MTAPKSIFIRNKYRERSNQLNNNIDFQTEHERLNREPEHHDVVKDFEYAKRNPLSVPRKPKIKRPTTVVSGSNNELSWVPPEEISNVPRPIETYDGDPNVESFDYDSVPKPEVRSRSQPRPEHKPQPQQTSLSIDDISDGNYFIVILDEIIVESKDLSVIEEFVERTIFNENNISLDDIVVLRKMKIKLGVNIG